LVTEPPHQVKAAPLRCFQPQVVRSEAWPSLRIVCTALPRARWALVTQPLQHMKAPALCCRTTHTCILGAGRGLGPHPLQHLEAPASGRNNGEDCRVVRTASCWVLCMRIQELQQLSPLAAVTPNVMMLTGQGGSCKRGHLTTSERPCLAASVLVSASQGQHGSSSQKPLGALRNLSTARCPPAAAAVHTLSSQGQGGCCARSHCSSGSWALPAAARQAPALYGQGGSCVRSHSSTS
jgi:hypothetical protein